VGYRFLCFSDSSCVLDVSQIPKRKTVLNELQIIALILLYQAIRGSLKGRADTIQTDPEYRDHGWKAKWKVDSFGERIPLELSTKNKFYRQYLKYYKIEFEEKFKFSSEWLVMFTDKWHLINFFQARAIDIVLCTLANNYWLMLFQFIPAGIGFFLNFRKR